MRFGRKFEDQHQVGKLNGEAVEVKQRGGWKRVLSPAPVLYELPEYEGKE